MELCSFCSKNSENIRLLISEPRKPEINTQFFSGSRRFDIHSEGGAFSMICDECVLEVVKICLEDRRLPDFKEKVQALLK